MRKNKQIAFFFIGQSPRPDIMEDIRKSFGLQYDIAEYGALDGLDRGEISALAPVSAEDTLITKLRDGSQVRISAEAAEKLLAQKVKEAEGNGAALAAIMCTGEFNLQTLIPVITADDAFHRLQVFPEGSGKIGVIVPRAEQQETFAACYERYGLKVITGVADPYGDDAVIAAEARRLTENGADLICLDCMGFTPQQALLAEKACGKETRIPRTEIIKAIKETI